MSGVADCLRQSKPYVDAIIDGRDKLRQTVKDLTASSERLRTVNLKAIAKALRQEQEIQRLHEANDAQSHLINSQRQQIQEMQKRGGELPYSMPYVTWLEEKVRLLDRKLKQVDDHSVSVVAERNRLNDLAREFLLKFEQARATSEQLDREIDRLRRQVRQLEQALSEQKNLTDTWQTTAEQAHQGRETLRRALDDASAKIQQIKQMQHEQLRPILFAVADVYAGKPVTKIGLDPV